MIINKKFLLILSAALAFILCCSEDEPAGPASQDESSFFILQQGDTFSYLGDTLTLYARADGAAGDSIYYGMENLHDINVHIANSDFDPVSGRFDFYPATGDKPSQHFMFRAFNTGGDTDSTDFRVAVMDTSCPPNPPDSSMIIDHLCRDINSIPRSAIQGAIDNLVIAYGHTSHGSQLVTGMDSLANFLGDDLYNYSSSGAGNTLRLIDRP
ncbi:MAG: hypothetical protein GF417_11140, partial [Candidatus Latescibacteria bacterium]|nr:hypothetical protein [bacterium]MBD3424980.1 hypothetical protein [Candidatus Latescibacterota bacterium]